MNASLKILHEDYKVPSFLGTCGDKNIPTFAERPGRKSCFPPDKRLLDSEPPRKNGDWFGFVFLFDFHLYLSIRPFCGGRHSARQLDIITLRHLSQ